MVASVALAHAEPNGLLSRYSRSEIHMGVEFQVVLYASDSRQADEAMTKAMQRVAELDKALSDYDLESELSKLSETSVGRNQPEQDIPPVKVSEDLWNVLSAAQEISRHSDGALDVTIGPLTKLWRRARRWKELPEAEQLAEARSSVGWQFLKLDARSKTAQLLKPDMRLDLGGIAKGYAAEEAVKAVMACGIASVLVRGSGDIATADPPPGERGWRVGIAPLDPTQMPSRFVEIAHCCISTSGDAQQHLIVDGRRYSHILDPRTGLGVPGRSSVTVIAPRGAIADGLDTAICVLGPHRGRDLVAKYPGAEFYMVHEDAAGTQRTVESPEFKRFNELKP